jgi:hypothetical protein
MLGLGYKIKISNWCETLNVCYLLLNDRFYMKTEISVCIITLWMFGYLTLNVRFKSLKSKFSVGVSLYMFGYMILKVKFHAWKSKFLEIWM